MPLTSPLGSLQRAGNAHINRGGAVEKRKAFERIHSVPAETFGLAATRDKIYVFGSVSDPGVPAGITYQRLTDPDGMAMTAIRHTAVYDGKVYAIAEFGSGRLFHFFDGRLVDDWVDGVVRASFATRPGIIAHMQALVDKDEFASAEIDPEDDEKLLITSNPGKSLAVEASAEDGEGNAFDDQTFSVTTLQAALVGVEEKQAVGQILITGGKKPDPAVGNLDITGGSAGAGNAVAAVLVNDEDILEGAVDFQTDADVTASDVADQINLNTGETGYTAEADGNTVNISDASGARNGFAVTATTSGDVTTGNYVDLTGGYRRDLSSIRVAGQEILGSPVSFNTSVEFTASIAADAINSELTSPVDYSAVADGNTLSIVAMPGEGSSQNGATVTAVFTNGTTETEVQPPPPEVPAPPPPPPPAPAPEETYDETEGGD